MSTYFTRPLATLKPSVFGPLGGLINPKKAGPVLPADTRPPAITDPEIQAAGNEARANAAAAYGRYNTILTSGMGVQQPAQTQKKTLLGGAA